MKMNPNIKALWVEALRSGKYTQGTGALKDEHGFFCCLGVLCDLAVNEGLGQWVKTATPDGPGFDFRDVYGDEVTSFPTAKVIDWADLPSSNPRVRSLAVNPERDLTLTSLNDEQHFSFCDIADLIETQL